MPNFLANVWISAMENLKQSARAKTQKGHAMSKSPLAQVSQSSALVLTQQDGIFTTSRIIAEFLGKEHRNILRAIHKIKNQLETSESRPLNFELATYTDEQGKPRPEYKLNVFAFSLLMTELVDPELIPLKAKIFDAFEKAQKAAEQRNKELLEEIEQLRHDNKLLFDAQSTPKYLYKPRVPRQNFCGNITDIQNGVLVVQTSLSQRTKMSDLQFHLGKVSALSKNINGMTTKLEASKSFLFKNYGIECLSDGSLVVTETHKKSKLLKLFKPPEEKL
jgi:Rha family phage regulatory protein